MRLDRKLNLIIPVDRELPDRRKAVAEVREGDAERRVADTGYISKMYVHHMPVAPEVLDAHYRVLSRLVTVIYTEQHNVYGNPGLCSRLFRDTAKEMGRWDGADGVEATFLPELRRLSNVVFVDPNGAGWKTTMFQQAVDEKLFDDDEIREIEGFLIFFTTILSTRRASEMRAALLNFALMSGMQCSSSTLAEFRMSLPTSTATETSPARAPLSSIAV